jgi:hypothetical protein
MQNKGRILSIEAENKSTNNLQWISYNNTKFHQTLFIYFGEIFTWYIKGTQIVVHAKMYICYVLYIFLNL